MAGESSVNTLPGPLALPGRRRPSRKTMALSYSRTTCRGKQKLGRRGRCRTGEREDVCSVRALQRQDFSRYELLESPVTESLYPCMQPGPELLSGLLVCSVRAAL